MQIGFGQISPSASSTRDLETRLARRKSSDLCTETKCRKLFARFRDNNWAQQKDFVKICLVEKLVSQRGRSDGDTAY